MKLRTALARSSTFSFLSPPHLSVPFGLQQHRRILPFDFRRTPHKFQCAFTTTATSETRVLLDDDSSNDTVEQLLSPKNRHNISTSMKMERKLKFSPEDDSGRWFPYLDKFRTNDGVVLSSEQVIEAIEPHLLDLRKERLRNVVKNRSYGVSLVVEGLSDFGNVSAAFRSADAFGFQSVHVVSCDCSKRFRENRHISMGSEKWLDIEAWNSTRECFDVLRSRGYRIATTYLGNDTVSIYDMDWSCPTAIVVGNENSGISKEALQLSDLHCSIPMNGMVDSLNVSVAAGIAMHHAVCDRTSRLGSHGDLTPEETQILLAEFSLRHSQTAIEIASEYARRNLSFPTPKL
ncbi:uncharacterized protein LOC141622431 [Silene latifolia]|uniref:uncharacterized protein LOC141622431 n=1 Tax=Silene latifolia TaxID=37657 RepID=UPI003D77D3D5